MSVADKGFVKSVNLITGGCNMVRIVENSWKRSLEISLYTTAGRFGRY